MRLQAPGASRDRLPRVPGASRSRLPRVPSVFCAVPAAQQVVRELPPLVVLRGPRGFGKTSTVAYWLRSGDLDDRSAVWLSVPPGTTAAGLWAGMHHSLVVVGLASAQEQEQPGRRAVELMLQRLTQRVVVVIDGLHHVTDPGIDTELVALAQACDLLHLIVTSRVERPIESIGPATVDTALLRAPELALGVPETILLAARLGIELSEREARALVEELAGWPVLVCAVLLDSRRGADGRLTTEMAAVTRYISLLLNDAENVAWRDVATALAIPDRLDPADLPVLLDGERLRTGAFTLPDAALLVRSPSGGAYPRGLRVALLELLRTEEPGRYRRLSEQLGRHRRGQGRHAEALLHAVRAEAWPLALGVLEENWAQLLREHRTGVEEALRAMPRELVDSSARLTVARHYVLDRDTVAAAEAALRGGLLVPGGELPARRLTTTQRLALRFDHAPSRGAADVLLGRLDSPLAEDGQSRLEADVRRAVPELLTEWGLSLLYGNDGVGAAYGFASACREAAAVGDDAAAREAAVGTAVVMALLGHLGAAMSWLDHAAAVAARPSQLETVAEPLTRAVVDGSRLAGRRPPATRPPAVGQGLGPLLALSRIAAASGDILDGELDRARVELQRYGTDGDDDLAEVVRASATALRVDLALAEGRLDRAGALLAESHEGGSSMRSARARHAFYVGAYAEALRLTAGARSDVGVRPRAGLELLLVRACACWRLDRPEEAVDHLAGAVGIAADTGMLLPFRTVPRGDLEAMAPPGTWVRQFLDQPALIAADCPFPEPLPAGELSAAELRVLRELRAGIPLSHIARGLFIAESTVKTHVQRIYRKLGVSSRADALLRARELSLLA